MQLQEEFLTIEEMDTWVMLKYNIPSAFDYVFEWLLGNVSQDDFPFTTEQVDQIFAAKKQSRDKLRSSQAKLGIAMFEEKYYELKKTR